MLYIILLLLKIIGILLLSVLGLILLLLLTILLVPIRYRVAIEHGENLFYLKGRVNWLMHLLHVSISHIDGLLHIRARLFGYVVYDNLTPKKPKKPKAEKKKIVKKKTIKRKETKTKETETKETKTKETKRIETKSKDNKSNEVNSKETNSKETNSKEPINMQASKKTIDTAPTEHLGKPADENPISREAIPMSKAMEQVESLDASRDTKKATIFLEDVITEEQENRKSFFKKVLERIHGIRDKTITAFKEWKVKLSRIFSTIATFKFKFDLILSFLRDEMNKDGMRVTFTSLKRMVKHILPTTLRSKLIFGTGDPCSTGQALGAMSILYSFYGDKIQITPDFFKNRLEGNHFAKGRIRLGTILIIVVKLMFDRKFKQLKNNFMILKEAL